MRAFDWDWITSLVREHSLSISSKPRCPPVFLPGFRGGWNFNQSKKNWALLPHFTKTGDGEVTHQDVELWAQLPWFCRYVSPKRMLVESASLTCISRQKDKSGQIHQFSIIWLIAALGQTWLSSPWAKVLSTLLNIWWSLEVLYNLGFWIMFSFKSCLPV